VTGVQQSRKPRKHQPLVAVPTDLESRNRRAGFSPYGPSKAALESETIMWSQDLAGTGVTVNALLPG